MATTVTYKGATLTTVDNQTKVLETAGTWLEDDIEITDVSSGASNEDALIERSITSYSNSNVTTVGANVFRDWTTLTSISFPNVTRVKSFAFSGLTITKLTDEEFPSLQYIDDGSAFRYCRQLTKICLPTLLDGKNSAFADCNNVTMVAFPSFLASNYNSTYELLMNLNKMTVCDMGVSQTLNNYLFSGCSVLETIILRKADALCNLGNIQAFRNATCYRSGGSGGEIYIPKVFYDHLGDGSTLDYQSATNWATLYAEGALTFRQLEGSAYESVDWWRTA